MKSEVHEVPQGHEVHEVPQGPQVPQGPEVHEVPQGPEVHEVPEDKSPTKITELCLAGAANRGISYIGVLKCLDEYSVLDLKKFVGVSIGSFIGVCYIVGYTPDEIFKDVLEKDLSEFEDISLACVMNNGSVLSGINYRTWVWDVLCKKIDPMTTFKLIYEKFGVDVTITAVSLDSGEDGLEYFSLTDTPDMPIYYAILASMTVPLVFPPLVYNGKRYIDGGVLENFPMQLLSKDAIGFRVTSQQIEADVTNMTYLGKMMQLVTTKLRKMVKFEGTAMTIDASDYSMISFALSVDNKITLYYRGYNTALEYCLKFF
jgi:NTE family protein